MKKIIIGLLVIICLAFLGYVYMHSNLNSEKSVQAPSKLENCQNLKINDLNLITFANKCLLEYGNNRGAYAFANNLKDEACPKDIADFSPPEIKRYSETEIRKFYESKNEKVPEIKYPDEWVVFYHSKKGSFANNYVVRISLANCECNVDGVR